jgi:DNA-binding MarR family transcriptional regulator
VPDDIAARRTPAKARRKPGRPARTGNLLGALALQVVDRMFDSIDEATGEEGTTAVALSALHQFLDQPTIDLLRRVLGLTSSGAVRLVNRLERAGWVERAAADDGRATAVRLTRAGRVVAKRIAAARINALDHALTALTPGDRAQLDAIASRLLVSMRRGPSAHRWMCRLCDMQACGWASGGCPVRNARAHSG